MKKIYLVGLPNAGKSSIFNKLTHSDVHTGNWHGVTVNKSIETVIIENEKYLIADLPGIYGLVPFSPEEGVSVSEILDNQDSIFVNVIDCNNLERSLNLTLQLLELGLSVTVLLNFIEDSKKRGVLLDSKSLANSLGITVENAYLNAKKLQKTFENIVKNAKKSQKITYLQRFDLNLAQNVVKEYCDEKYVLYNSLRLVEGDTDNFWKCTVPLKTQPTLKNYAIKNGLELLYNLRVQFIKKVMFCCVRAKPKAYGSSKFDKIFLNKFTALPVFFVIMFIVFWFTFGVFGGFLSEIAVFLVNFCGKGLFLLLTSLSAPVWLQDFVNNAIISGVGSVFGFLTQVILLFLFLEILEQSGYLCRIAWLMEAPLAKIGLSGRSVFSLLMGFGCSTTAIPTTTTLQNERARTKTAILIPFMSCSAKLPVYSAIAGAFFGGGSVLLIFSLYLLGIVVALLIALLIQKFYPTKYNDEMLEFTPFRNVKWSKIFAIVGQNSYRFIARIFTVLLACTIIIWFFNNFTITLEYITNPEIQHSILETISLLIAPIFSPLGFGWGAVCVLLFGLVAKELIISGIAVLNGVVGASIGASLWSGGIVSFTPESCVAFLVFCLLYSPCISALISLKNVVSKKVFWLYFVAQFGIAYLFSFICYKVSFLIAKIGFANLGWLLIVSIFVIAIICWFLIRLGNKRKCMGCNRCNLG